MASDNTEDYIWCLRRVYKLLNAETFHSGALSFLPAGGVECERLVEKAVRDIEETLGERLKSDPVWGD